VKADESKEKVMSNHSDEARGPIEFDLDVTIEELEPIIAPGIAMSPILFPPGIIGALHLSPRVTNWGISFG
jgi:hypothetical protein